MKLGSCFSLFPNLPLMGGALLLALCLCSCGDKGREAGAAEAGNSEGFSPVESYEELLSPVSYTHLTLPTICSV